VSCNVKTSPADIATEKNTGHNVRSTTQQHLRTALEAVKQLTISLFLIHFCFTMYNTPLREEQRTTVGSTPAFYAIYDADGSFMGEVRYLRDKCLGKADCALCDLSHGWNPLGRSDWRRRKGVAASLNWLHRDELPGHVAAQVRGQLPCVAVDRNGEIEIVIGRDALRGCEGDFSVFEHLLEQTLRTVSQTSPASGDGPRT
jgi:hypothetical protein